MKKAQEKAKKILTNKDASQKEVDQALRNLLKAIDNLEDKNVVDQDKGSNNSSDSNTIPPNKRKGESKGKVDEAYLNNNKPEKIEKKEKNSGTEKIKEVDRDNRLPKTATPIFSIIFTGFILLVIGLAYFLFQYTVRRRQI